MKIFGFWRSSGIVKSIYWVCDHPSAIAQRRDLWEQLVVCCVSVDEGLCACRQDKNIFLLFTGLVLNHILRRLFMTVSLSVRRQGFRVQRQPKLRERLARFKCSQSISF
jgi:hypothetical protein